MAEQAQTHGILVVDKPEGSTSHDVVARVRRILKTKRVGHTGTLDPFATGVLVLLLGKATRVAQFIDKDEKEYEATLQFGFETDTGDKTGVRTNDSGLAENEIAKRLASIDWENVLSKFRGEIEQVPPMYSAKKVEGKKLYELARAGKKIERKPVGVEIKALDIVNGGKILNPSSEIPIRVVCSAGTYIRTLAEDIGRHIGVGAHLQELRRTRAGRFSLNGSVTLDALESAQDRLRYLRPMEDAVAHLPRYVLSDDRVVKTLNGLSTRLDRTLKLGQPIQMVNAGNQLIAIGFVDADESSIKPRVILS